MTLHAFSHQSGAEACRSLDGVPDSFLPAKEFEVAQSVLALDHENLMAYLKKWQQETGRESFSWKS